jgi:hypothetical protein
MDTAAMLLAFCGEASLRAAAAELLRLASEAARCAEGVRGDVGIPYQEVASAAAELSRADDATRLQAVIALGRRPPTSSSRRTQVREISAGAPRTWRLCADATAPGALPRRFLT